MSDYAPPPGPPPPHVPEGWKAMWNDQYSEWFYVNLYTKKSQWEKPTEPAHPLTETGAPPGPPPSYNEKEARPLQPEKSGLSSNNPYGPSGRPSHELSEDERLARQLQAEEEARAHGAGRPSSRGAAEGYYNQPGYNSQQALGGQLPPRPEEARGSSSGKKGGLFGKLLGKAAGVASSSSHHQPYPGQGHQSHPQYYAGPPQGQYGYAPQAGYYGQGGYGHGPGIGMGMMGGMGHAMPARRHGGGMGAGGAAALGVGGGLLGGMMLADAMDDHEYAEGYEEGVEDAGGDFDGGDMGGDF